MMDMVERVARALAGPDADKMADTFAVTDMGRMGMVASATGALEPQWHSYRAKASAAIEAIRDFDFANSELWEFPLAYSDVGGQFERRWKEIFDTALNPQSQP